MLPKHKLDQLDYYTHVEVIENVTASRDFMFKTVRRVPVDVFTLYWKPEEKVRSFLGFSWRRVTRPAATVIRHHFDNWSGEGDWFHMRRNASMLRLMDQLKAWAKEGEAAS